MQVYGGSSRRRVGDNTGIRSKLGAVILGGFFVLLCGFVVQAGEMDTFYRPANDVENVLEASVKYSAMYNASERNSFIDQVVMTIQELKVHQYIAQIDGGGGRNKSSIWNTAEQNKCTSPPCEQSSQNLHTAVFVFTTGVLLAFI